MKKLLTFSLVSLVLMGFASFTSAQTVSLPDTTVSPGTTIWIPVTTTDVSPSLQVYSYQMEFTYDHNVCTIDSYDVTGTLVPQSWINTFNFANYVFTDPDTVNGGSWYFMGPYLQGAGTLIKLRCNISPTAAGATSALTFNFFQYWETFYPTVNGAIHVAGGLPHIQGYVYLQNQTNHAGTQIFFEATGGGAVSATTYSDSTGYYHTYLNPGTYLIHWTHPGYYPEEVSFTCTVNQWITARTLEQINVYIISGNCLLEGQTNHAGSLVIFYALSPYAVSDTTYTDSSGFYTTPLTEGIYDVFFYHDGYEPAALWDQSLYSSQTLPAQTLIPVPPTIYVSLPSMTVPYNSQIQVPITVSYVSVTHIVMTYYFEIYYNPAAITLAEPPFTIGIPTTLTPSNWSYEFETPVPGIITGNFWTTDTLSIIYGAGDLIIFNFNTADSSVVPISSPLTFLDFGFNEGNIEVTLTNGNITVPVKNIDPEVLPSEYCLHQNYPNPFNPTTSIVFDLPTESKVHLAVYNLLGEEVAVLAEGTYDAGSYKVDFNAKGLPTGLYFCKLTANNFTQTNKLILVE